jgi:hypothetical protein
MGKGGGGGQQVQQAPPQTIQPDRNNVLSEGQRATDNLLADYTMAMMRANEGNYNHTPMQLYPLNNYMRTSMPVFNQNAYNQMYGNGYGVQSLNSVTPFGLSSAGRFSPPTQYQPPSGGSTHSGGMYPPTKPF